MPSAKPAPESYGSGMEELRHLEPCKRFSLTTMSLAMSLQAGMPASLTAEQVLLRTMLPMGRVMALASLMPCEEPEASTTASKACRVGGAIQSRNTPEHSHI